MTGASHEKRSNDPAGGAGGGTLFHQGAEMAQPCCKVSLPGEDHALIIGGSTRLSS